MSGLTLMMQLCWRKTWQEYEEASIVMIREKVSASLWRTSCSIDLSKTSLINLCQILWVLRSTIRPSKIREWSDVHLGERVKTHSVAANKCHQCYSQCYSQVNRSLSDLMDSRWSKRKMDSYHQCLLCLWIHRPPVQWWCKAVEDLALARKVVKAKWSKWSQPVQWSLKAKKGESSSKKSEKSSSPFAPRLLTSRSKKQPHWLKYRFAKSSKSSTRRSIRWVTRSWEKWKVLRLLLQTT